MTYYDLLDFTTDQLLDMCQSIENLTVPMIVDMLPHKSYERTYFVSKYYNKLKKLEKYGYVKGIRSKGHQTVWVIA